jgi:hypothetical protein
VGYELGNRPAKCIGRNVPDWDGCYAFNRLAQRRLRLHQDAPATWARALIRVPHPVEGQGSARSETRQSDPLTGDSTRSRYGLVDPDN